MIPLLAQVAPDNAQHLGWVGLALIALLQLAFLGKQVFGGNKGERQIEPTQLAGLTAEIRAQTVTLNAINREVGEVKTSVEGLTEQMAGMHHRVGGISRDLAGVTARVDGLEKREGVRNA